MRSKISKYQLLLRAGLMTVITLAFMMMPGSEVEAQVDSTGGSFEVVGPTISAVQASDITRKGAVINWVTDVVATSQVFYDIQSHENAESYLYQTTEDDSPVIDHQVSLAQLSPRTVYHFRVKSTISDIDTVSDDYTFTTLSTSNNGGSKGTASRSPTLVKLIQQEPENGVTTVTLTDLLLNENGIAQTAGSISTLDGGITLNVAKGVKLLTAQGQPITSLFINTAKEIPAPPSQNIIILAYDLGPSGATFSPPMTLTLRYDPATLPTGVLENTLYIAYWDGSQWQKLASTVDTEAKAVTALVSHFTQFCIMGQTGFSVSSLEISPEAVDTGEDVIISAYVTNNSDESGSYKVALKINGIIESTKELNANAGSTTEVAFAVSKDKAGTYAVDINGLTGSFTVREKTAISDSSEFAVSNLVVTPGEIYAGDAVSIEVLVTNTGEVPGNYEVALKINGEVEATQDVRVEARNSRKVTFSVSIDTIGSYGVDINGLSGSFTVKEKPVAAEKPFNWLIIVVIGGLIVVGLLLYFLMIKRRK